MVTGCRKIPFTDVIQKVWGITMRTVVAFVACLLTSAANAAPVAVTVDTTANVHPFSPLIFGVAYGDATRNAQVGYTVRRWGGNSTTRYNWQYDIHSTASDYFYENIPDSQDRTHIPPLGNSADAFVTEARTGGAQPLIAIPTIGLKPLDNSALQHPYTVGFSVAKYGAQKQVDQYDTNAGNGVLSNGTTITNNAASDTSDAAPPSYEAAWIAHLQSVFGTAANGGVKFYSLDNEVMLWNSTHRDVHPTPPTYDEIWNKAVSYATAIKMQEPNAIVTGPVTWGYPDLFTSAADAASCTCFSGADRGAHSGTPFVAWYLQQIAAHPLSGGAPLVDYLDLHYYPQDPGGASGSIYSGAEDSATVGRRLRSLNELYDPNWISNRGSAPSTAPKATTCPGTTTKPQSHSARESMDRAVRTRHQARDHRIRVGRHEKGEQRGRRHHQRRCRAGRSPRHLRARRRRPRHALDRAVGEWFQRTRVPPVPQLRRRRFESARQ